MNAVLFRTCCHDPRQVLIYNRAIIVRLPKICKIEAEMASICAIYA